MNTTSIAKLVTFVLFGQLVVACGGGGGGGGGSGGGGPTDTTAPTATVATNAPAVPDPALIPEYTVIIVTFSESMDSAGGAWQLGGDLAAESNGGVWSTTTAAHDTLTIRPTSNWFAKPGRTLTLSARDLAGNPLAPLSLSYDIYRGLLYYVDSDRPDDNGNGLNPVTARRFIHTAVADAVPPATVLVKAGDYRLSHALGTHVVLQEAVSLYGGYNANFDARNVANNITTIEDRSTTGGSDAAPRAAIVGSGSITSTTVVDGFTLQGSTQGAVYTAAILSTNGAAPTIENNDILGGSGGASSYGVHNNGSSPTIQANTIHGGGGGAVWSYGVFNYEGATAVIRNNTIHGGAGSNGSRGVGNINASPRVQNNTIHGGVGNDSVGIFSSGGVSNPARPYIDNNIILARSTGTCIYGAGQSSKPSSLRNNDLWNCVRVFVDDPASCPGNADGDNNAYTCSLTEMNALTGIPGGVGGNVSIDPLFADIDGADNSFNTMADNDWRFSPGSPATVTAGGLNGIDAGWTFITDKDGSARPASGNAWSIGAYEP